MRPPDPEELAKDIVNATYQAARQVKVNIDTGGWTTDHVKRYLDKLMAYAPGNEVRVRGVRMDRATATALGLDEVEGRFGPYQGVPVAALRDQFEGLEVELVPLK